MYFSQLESFPSSKFKDMVDATSTAFLEIENTVENYFMTHDAVRKSIEKGFDSTPPETPTDISISCYVARTANEKTVIGYRLDEVVLPFVKSGVQSADDTANVIISLGKDLMQKYNHIEKIPVKISDSAFGDVLNVLNKVKKNSPKEFKWLEIFPVNFGQRINNKRYFDTTSWMWHCVKDSILNHGLVLPDDYDMLMQLSFRRYSVTEESKIRVESRDEIKEDGRGTTDEADCLALLCLPVTIK